MRESQDSRVRGALPQVRAASDARRCDRRATALAGVPRVGGEAVTDTLDSLRAERDEARESLRRAFDAADVFLATAKEKP